MSEEEQIDGGGGAFIEFQCDNCGVGIRVTQGLAGKEGKCPKCKSIIFVPKVEQAELSESHRVDLDEVVVDVPEGAGYLADKGDVSDEGEQEPAEGGTGLVGERKLPWLIDIFLYPTNLAGIIHLICLWLLVFLFCPLVMVFLGLGIEYIPIVYTLPIAYVLYYFAECIRDSATGHCRAPSFWMHPADSSKWDVISQLLIVFGCIAVCFCPASVYYIVTERTDLIYRLLVACAGFFFPMVLLAVVLFDSYNALNPVLIIGSIFRTFLPYCGMVLLFYGGAWLLMKIDSRSYGFRLLPAVPFILRVVQLYLVFVAVGFLGRFYQRYKDKLDWEV